MQSGASGWLPDRWEAISGTGRQALVMSLRGGISSSPDSSIIQLQGVEALDEVAAEGAQRRFLGHLAQPALAQTLLLVSDKTSMRTFVCSTYRATLVLNTVANLRACMILPIRGMMMSTPFLGLFSPSSMQEHSVSGEPESFDAVRPD